MIAQPTLQRDFVILEPLEARHEHEIVASVQDPSIARFMTFADLNDERSVRSWFQSALQEPAKDVGTPFAVRHAINGTIVGSTSLYEINQRQRRCELGRSWLIPSVRRTGVNPRAKLLMLTYAFDTLGMERVQLRASKANTISRAAIESIGASFEGILRNYAVLPGGKRTDSALYSITREDWPKVQEVLRARIAK